MKKLKMFLCAILTVLIALSFSTIAFGAINSTAAKKIALNHAKLSASQVTALKVQSDYDDGIKIYEVEFHKGKTEYDYEINAKTGKIISVEKETEKVVPKKTTTSTTYISSAKAKSIALKHAGVAQKNASKLTAKLDTEKGVRIYEVSFTSGKTEYDYEINAKTGKIISVEKETQKVVTKKVTTSTAYISSAKAKSIALKHAGVAQKNASKLTAKLDTENGVRIYEVEFIGGRYEFDYEINAKTGKINSVDKEIA